MLLFFRDCYDESDEGLCSLEYTNKEKYINNRKMSPQVRLAPPVSLDFIQGFHLVQVNLKTNELLGGSWQPLAAFYMLSPVSFFHLLFHTVVQIKYNSNVFNT